MAMVGHGLIGLACAGGVSAKARGDRLRYVWAGLMVLLAYSVDLAEWFAILFDPELSDRRLITHSPLLVLGMAVVVCVLLGVYCRFRSPLPYVLILFAVVSHVLLDHPVVRAGIAEWYAGAPPDIHRHVFPAALPEEFCAYGAPLLWVLLLRAWFERGVPRLARVAAQVLIVAVAAAAWSRHAVVWVPVYAVAFLHAVIVLRRHINVRVVWSLVPLLPLAAPGATTWYMWHRMEQAARLVEQGDHAGAIRIYEGVLELPTRSGMHIVHLRLGMSYEQLGELNLAEDEYRRGAEVAGAADWCDLALAGLYGRHEGTSFFKPDLAMRMYTDIIAAGDTPVWISKNARFHLRALRERYGGEP